MNTFQIANKIDKPKLHDTMDMLRLIKRPQVWNIIKTITESPEALCVNDIAAHLGKDQSFISDLLQQLKAWDLVDFIDGRPYQPHKYFYHITEKMVYVAEKVKEFAKL